MIVPARSTGNKGALGEFPNVRRPALTGQPRPLKQQGVSGLSAGDTGAFWIRASAVNTPDPQVAIPLPREFFEAGVARPCQGET